MSIQCVVGYADLRQLTPAHLTHEPGDVYCICKPRQKTGQQCIIPLLPAAEKILKKYSPTGTVHDFQ